MITRWFLYAATTSWRWFTVINVWSGRWVNFHSPSSKRNRISFALACHRSPVRVTPPDSCFLLRDTSSRFRPFCPVPSHQRRQTERSVNDHRETHNDTATCKFSDRYKWPLPAVIQKYKTDWVCRPAPDVHVTYQSPTSEWEFKIKVY